MARYYYRNNWNRSGRYYGRNRYYKRSSTRVKSWGNMKAAKQQADQSTFTINVPSTMTVGCKGSVNPLDTNKTVNFGIYPLNIFEVLRKSEFFSSYANMYDEFKLDRIKVKLLPTEFSYTASSNGNGRYSNVTVYTAWDRTGLNPDQLILVSEHGIDSANQIGNGANGDGLYCIVGSDITTYSSAESRTVNPGTNTTITRWLNPKTIQEKGQWISTSMLKQWYSGYNETDFYFWGIPTGNSDSNKQLTNYGDVEIEADINLPQTDGGAVTHKTTLKRIGTINSDNPCFLLEDQGIRFKPTLLVGIYPPNQTNVCKFNVETEVVCTFRGLRKAAVVAA